MHHRKSPLFINLATYVLAIVLSSAPTMRAEVNVRQDANTVILSNGKVELKFDSNKRSFSIKNTATGEVVLDGARMSANGSESRKQDGKAWQASQRLEEVEDASGKGRRLVVSLSASRFPAVPTYLFSYTLYEGNGAVFMGFGMHNTRHFDLRLMDSQPMTKATLLPGRKIEQVMTLNGSAGAEKAEVKPGAARESANSLLLTCTVDGQRRTVLWGGLANKEFGKWTSINPSGLECSAKDPVGRLVDAGQTYWSEDTFYVDVSTADPFAALEQYGRAMRLANHARPNVYDFPVLCGWGVGALSGLPGVNNSAKLVGELEAAVKAGVT